MRKFIVCYFVKEKVFTWLSALYKVSQGSLSILFLVLILCSHKERNESKLHAICQIEEAVARWCSIRKFFLKILQISQESTYAGSFSFNKATSQKPATLFKMGLQYRFFPVNCTKSSRTPILQKIYKQLLLKHFFFHRE